MVYVLRGFQWLEVSMVYVSVDYFDAFQFETRVDLRWCAHSDLHIVFSETIVYVSKIIVSCF